MKPKTNIVFFDLPTTIGVATSPNTWKVRLALNYKRLSYKTQWVPTSSLEPTLRALHIPPTTTKPNGDPKWTLPALIDYTPSQPVILADSTPIIEYLDRTYPSPSLFFPPGTRALHSLFEAHLRASVTAHLLPLNIMALYEKKTPDDQLDFRTRLEKANKGKKLEDMEAKGSERDEAWGRIERAFSVFSDAIEKNALDGDHVRQEAFVMGSPEPTFADLTLCAQILALKHISPDDAWARVKTWDGGRWERYVGMFEKAGWADVN